MKRIFFLLIAMLLVACSAAPTQPTAQVVVATVLVPVEVTSAATPIPPAAQVVVATVLVPVTSSAPTTAPTVDTNQAAVPTTGAPVSSGPIALDPKYNGQSFEKITISGDKFSLNCQPKEISFDVYSTDIYIVRTDLYFRMRDKHSADIPEWTVAGTMQTDGGNHFWMTLKGDQIKADLRKYQGWFDFEFVGLNRQGDAVGRSAKITDIVSYTINCQ